MRVLLLVSNIVIGASFLASAGGVYAAPMAKAHKHALSKGKRHAALAKQKIADPGNVWRRISAGLRLPRPDLQLAALNAQIHENKYGYLQGAAAKYNQIASSAANVQEPVVPELITENEGLLPDAPARSRHIIVPVKAIAPKNNYTALGRKLLGNMPSDPVGDCEPKKSVYSRLGSAKQLNTRIRTQFNYYPELHKHTPMAKTVAYNERVNGNVAQDNPCTQNDLKKVVRLAQNTPVLPPTSQTDAIQPDVRLQLLAAKQQEQEAQRSTKLATSSERVNKYVEWYAQRRGYLHEVSERAKPYLYHIVEGLNKQHLPLDLALLPIVESAYQPTAQSPMSAAGLWQFIPSTGADYNLKQDAHYDERLDITASTQAAISYLAFLNHRFKGDWLLALAAYNCGIGRVEEAVNRNRAEGLDTDYWSLPLPEETQAYVPRLLALSRLMSNPAGYNLNMTPVKDEPHFITVSVDRKLDMQNLANKDLRAIAELADVPYDQFTLLNPGYLETTLPPDRPFSFLLPIANANQLYRRLSMLVKINSPEPKPIAVAEAPVLSQFTDPATPYAAHFLSLPINDLPVQSLQAAAEKPVKTTPNQQTAHAPEKYLTVHYVDKGETLLAVAKNFDVSVEAVRSLNKLKRKQGVFMGQRLTIPPKQAKTIMLEADNGRIMEDAEGKAGGGLKFSG